MAATIKVNFVGDAKKLKRTISTTQAALNGLGRAAKVGGIAIAAGVAFAAAKSITSFASFDTALNRSQSIMGDLTDNQMAAMETAARELGKTTLFSATEGAQAFEYLALAGLGVEEQLDALPVVANFAQAGMFDLSTATDLLTDAQSALGLKTGDAGKDLSNMTALSDALTDASTFANASVEEFAIALTTKAAVAMNTWGVSMEEGIATLAVLADKGIKSETAGTKFATTITNLTTAAVKNADAFAALGIEVFDSEGQMASMADIIGDVETAFVGMTDEQKKKALLDLGFADKAQQVILALVGSSEAIREWDVDLQNAGGTTQEVSDKQLNTLSAKFTLLKGKIEDVAITVGEKLAPSVETAIGFLEGLGAAWNPEPIPPGQYTGTTTEVRGLAGAMEFLDEKSTLIIPVLTAVGVLLTGVMLTGTVALIAAMSPLVLTVGGVVLAITALTAGFTYLYRENETFRSIVDTVIDALGWLWDKFTDLIDAVGGWKVALAVLSGPIGIAILLFTKFRDTIVDALTKAYDWVKEKIDGIVRKVKGIGAAIGGGAAAAFNGIKDSMTSAWKFVKTKIDQIVALPNTIWRRVKNLIRTVAFDGIKDSMTSAWKFVKTKIDQIVALPNTIWRKVKNLIRTVAFDGIKDSITSAYTWVKGRIWYIVEAVKGLKGRVTGAVGNAFQGVSSQITRAYDWVKGRITLIVGKVKGLKSRITGAAKGLFDGIKGAFRAALNWVIGKWNRLSFTLPSFSAFGRKIGGGTISTPNIPLLAQGGLIKDPTLAVVGDTPGEAEIVSPVSMMRRTVDEALAANAQIQTQPPGNTGGISIGTINMNTDADIGDLSRELRWLQVTEGAS